MNAQELGRLMELKLREPYDVVSFSRWAFRTYLDNIRELPDDLEDILIELGRMEDDVGFEYTYEEIRDVMHKLLDR